MRISDVCRDIDKCKEILDRLEQSVQNGKISTMTAHAITVKVNEYLEILESELDN